MGGWHWHVLGVTIVAMTIITAKTKPALASAMCGHLYHTLLVVVMAVLALTASLSSMGSANIACVDCITL